MSDLELERTVQRHVEQFFVGHDIEYFSWQLGPVVEALPGFRVARVAPGPKVDLWAYVSVGSSQTVHSDSGRLEFLLICPHETPRAVELLAMISHRHLSDPLGKWHLMPIGEPWIENATCDVFFISPPYPFGPELEICSFADGHIHVLWLLPITHSERAFCKQHGADALETEFDKAALQYWRLDRQAVV